MSLTAAQLELRRSGITATDAVTLSGVGKWGSPLEVYEAKMGAPSKASTLAMQMGHAAEDVIAGAVAAKYKLVWEPGETIRDSLVPWYLATPDRMIGRRVSVLGGHTRITCDAVGEFKLVGWRMVPEWYDEDNALVFPASLAVQTSWQMGVSRARNAYVGAFLGGWAEDDFHAMEVGFDENLWGSLREIMDKFWQDHVVARKPPPPDASDRNAEILVRMFPAIKRPILLDAPADVGVKMQRYLDLNAQIAGCEHEKAGLSNGLKLDVGDAEGIRSGDVKAVWSPRIGGVDYGELCLAHGITKDEQEKHRKPGTRVLRVALISKKDKEYRHVSSKLAAAE